MTDTETLMKGIMNDVIMVLSMEIYTSFGVAKSTHTGIYTQDPHTQTQQPALQTHTHRNTQAYDNTHTHTHIQATFYFKIKVLLYN